MIARRAWALLVLWTVTGLVGCGKGSKPAPEPGTDEAILALKPPGTNAIIVRAIGYGQGTIAIADPGQTCVTRDREDSLHYSVECHAYVPVGTASVTVTAAALGGSRFTGWGDPCPGSPDPSCVVPMDVDRTITVGFVPDGAIGPKSAYRLYLHVLGVVDGDISAPAGIGWTCVPSEDVHYVKLCSGLVPATTPPTEVTLTATPAAGTQLAGWGGSCSGTLTGTCTVTMDEDRGVTVAFVRGGGASSPIVCTAPFVPNDVGTACVCPAGYHLDGGSCAADIVVTPPSASWSVVPNPNDDPLYGFDPLYGIGGASADRIWAVGQGVILAWDGTQWMIVGGGSQPYLAIWGLASSDFWVFSSYRQAYRCDLTTAACTTASFPGYWSTWYLYDLVAAWGSASNDVWAVDTYGYAIHWDGTSWTQVGGELNDRWWQSAYGTWFHDRWPLYGIWGSSADDVWAVGYNGAVVHWDGLAWSPTSRPTSSHLYGIWGSAADDVWAVGSGGTILHFDGVAWSSVSSSTTSDLMAVWGSSASDVWAVGAAGTAAHWDGVRWTSAVIGPAVTLRSVWGSSAGDVWAVGDRSTILRYH